MMKLFPALLFLSICLSLPVSAWSQTPYTQTPKRTAWNAQWIAAPWDDGHTYAVFHFRKSIELKTTPAAFYVHVSADNRYKLYVNGTLVSLGPARGDTYFWNYETVNLAPYLAEGKNTIAALVFNEADFRPEAQISVRTAFILQGNSAVEEVVNTNNTWKCVRDAGRQPVPGYFFAASKGEIADMSKAVKGDWTAVNYDDSAWANANKIMDGTLKGMAWGIDWALVPTTLPQPEMTYQRLATLRKATGITVPTGFPQQKTPLIIPANSSATLLLDQGFETNAYITVNMSGGKNARLSVGYAESLYERGSKGVRKGNRNVVEGKEFVGRIDSILADGSKAQTFTTLNYRTFRYIRLIINTKDEPLIIEDFYGTFTGYPFSRTSTFNTEDNEITRMLDIGWRTARLNAVETYMDCPYYEQLQYVGDTRIQAMVSYYNTPDDRLARNAITQIDHSRLAEGITRSCYPTKGSQIISPFSLWYIGMVHDYFMYRNDAAFIKDKLPGVRGVLEFFSKYQMADGSVKNTPYWAFVDWAGNLAGNVNGSDGCAAIYDLQLLWAYQWAAEMEAKVGLKDLAGIYTQKAAQLKATIQRKYWDASRRLYADTRAKKGYSQHANSLAILTGIVNPADMPALAKQLAGDKSLTQCSVYFKYYLNQALIKAGATNNYLSLIDIWRENMAMGLTTWAEYSDVNTSRSDCHAWGSSPNIEFFRTVLGIDSDAPGFTRVKIEPHLGNLKTVSGEVPHPNGVVAAAYNFEGNKWKINIRLPQKTTGTLIWKGKKYVLKTGANLMVM